MADQPLDMNSFLRSPVTSSSREYSTNYQLHTESERKDSEVSSTVSGSKGAVSVDLFSHQPDGGSTSLKTTRFVSKFRFCLIFFGYFYFG